MNATVLLLYGLGAYLAIGSRQCDRGDDQESARSPTVRDVVRGRRATAAGDHSVTVARSNMTAAPANECPACRTMAMLRQAGHSKWLGSNSRLCNRGESSRYCIAG